MLNDLVPNYIYKPGTRLVVNSKKMSKLLPESIITIVGYSIPYNTNCIHFLDNMISIDLNGSPSESIAYRVLIERIGKSGKKRMEFGEMNIPIFKTEEESIFTVETKQELLDTLSLKSDNDFTYWILSRLLFNRYVENLYLSKFKNVNKQIQEFFKVEQAIRYKHTSFLMHLLMDLDTEDEAKIQKALTHLSLQKNREEAILELREADARLSQAKIYYSVKLIGKLKICAEIFRLKKHPIASTEGWCYFERFLNNLLLVNKDILSGPAKHKYNLPYDTIMRDSLIYTMSHVL